jgi:hypothetical protein
MSRRLRQALSGICLLRMGMLLVTGNGCCGPPKQQLRIHSCVDRLYRT